MVDINECIEVLKRGQFLRPQAVLSICETVKSILFNEPNVLKIDPPVTVVGDIHGLLIIFNLVSWNAGAAHLPRAPLCHFSLRNAVD
ncbi:hypothetical protein IWQ60_007128 [Tieghemiomyces parasiticus]|uniref:Uncharacterized protein n=1 Tax=Tieghemiomyces parasiticus TaxID=78921 RepID=A0A9W7ZZE9_9FUNG|nr:hypothetical protein IWQ60_007128 [Tieghemiomyces parasiticus]